MGTTFPLPVNTDANNRQNQKRDGDSDCARNSVHSVSNDHALRAIRCSQVAVDVNALTGCIPLWLAHGVRQLLKKITDHCFRSLSAGVIFENSYCQNLSVITSQL